MSKQPEFGKVAVLKTSPETVLDDVQEVMRLANFEAALPKEIQTGLKINISWQTWYPACSSTPWQIEGVIQALQGAGYQDIVGVHNDTVVVDTSVGEFNNKHRFVTDKYDIPCIYLYEEDFEWFEYIPKNHKLLVLDKVYPKGLFIPRALVGMNMIQLPWSAQGQIYAEFSSVAAFPLFLFKIHQNNNQIRLNPFDCRDDSRWIKVRRTIISYYYVKFITS